MHCCGSLLNLFINLDSGDKRGSVLLNASRQPPAGRILNKTRKSDRSAAACLTPACHRSRSLREEVYRASLTKASSGELDNGPIIDKILSLRQETAKLLGFQNYGQVSMASKVTFICELTAVYVLHNHNKCHQSKATPGLQPTAM